MIEPALDVLRYVGPLLVAIKRQSLEGRSQKEIAKAINRGAAWVSRRVQIALFHNLVKVEKELHGGWGGPGWNGWRVNSVYLTEKGHEAVATILNLDPISTSCPTCGRSIDVTGYSGLIACPFCNHDFHVEGIDPQLYVLPSFHSAIYAFINTFTSEMEDDRPGRTGILGLPLGPARRLGWRFLDR